MKIFQNSVLNKYLKTQDEKKIDEMYSQFTSYFHNAEIQENIRNSKEEQFQEGFLRELFVKILGYTLNPEPNYNLTTELKNEKGAKKTDGAILKKQQGGSPPCVTAVIELKGTNTKDLDKINEQAFNYKNNHTDCVYVITSNFEKLRFYIHNAVAHIEFNLFTLTKEEFKIFWLCLNAGNLLGGVPEKVKQESTIVEENVTKQLYKDYSAFKHELWQNICKNRPDLDKLLLFKKTQKLLDRFLFVFFAEDSGLLPPNSISRMVERFEKLIELDAKKPLYEIFKQYFGYINKGRKGKTTQDDIFAYNGGLFLPDEILDTNSKGTCPLIDDIVLKPNVLKMTAYDFQSDVDVNILGHIFENSLNEIENVTAVLNKGLQPLVQNSGQISKRKKDGVFYTPKYITKYIVENTVSKLCEEKKTELNIVDEEYAKGRKNRKKATVQALYDNLQTYRNWLLEITICDPACGSGAFLNQALEFLINEHAYIDELQANLLEASLVFQDVSNHVLEKNIYGVDINDESVEIAKLSLWLRTAQRGRKLTSLNNNIKCGNSLIDDPEVAGEKAFIWQKEFPQVFQEKEKKIHHITWVTHNSRTSQRMIDHKVKKGDAVWFDEEAELKITEIIVDIVKESNINVLNYNICGDHIHILLVCEDEELSNIVRKLKGKSSQKYKEYLQIPKEEKFTLWAQKYNNSFIEDDAKLFATMEYIEKNREKHELPMNNGLQPLVQKMICTTEHAFRPEYKGGFDVIIGNPPYVRADTENDFFIKQRKYLDKSPEYETLYEKWDLMVPFYERSIKLLKNNGLHGFIVSNSISTSKYALKLQEWILKNKNLCSINYFENIEVFKNVGVIPIITIIKNELPDFKYTKIIHQNTFDNISVIEQTFDNEKEISPIKVFKKNYRETQLMSKMFY